MTKDEAEKAIRHLCHEWAKALSPDRREYPHFSAFKSWLGESGYSHYLTFALAWGRITMLSCGSIKSSSKLGDDSDGRLVVEIGLKAKGAKR